MLGYNLLRCELQNRFNEQKKDLLNNFCNLAKYNGFSSELYNCFFAACAIPNGLCCFDLLRFSVDTVLNIQLVDAATVPTGKEWQYIENIMSKNHFYLSYLNHKVICYCFYEDNLYKYVSDISAAVKVDFTVLQQDLCEQQDLLQEQIDIASILNHSKFLISPFRNTHAFASGKYFLTDEQQNICDEIFDLIHKKQGHIYCISSLVGSGKSMLIYHIAKQLLLSRQNALIINGGIYNDGHLRLKMLYGFDICTVKELSITLQCLKINNKSYCAVFVDHAQNFTSGQIKLICDEFLLQNIPVIFSCDITETDNIDIINYLKDNYVNIKIYNKYIENNLRYKSKINFTF